jgi:DNA-binding XRE family transcriptional regulator
VGGPPDELQAVERAILERIAANVRHWRIERGTTQQALADDLGVNLFTVRAIEGARKWPSLHILANVSLVLEVDIQRLFEPRRMVLRPRGRPRKGAQ